MPESDETFPLKTAPIEWGRALTLFERMAVGLLPLGAGSYPTQPRDSTPISGFEFSSGIVGGPEELDLDFETKRGGAWAVWLLGENSRLWVAARQGAPLDRVLYFLACRSLFSLSFRPEATMLTIAAAQADLTRAGSLVGYDVWTTPGMRADILFS